MLQLFRSSPLSQKIQLEINDGSVARIPPPPLPAELPTIVQFLINARVQIKIAPPLLTAVLPVIMQFVIAGEG